MAGKFGKVINKDGSRWYPLRATPGTAEFKKAQGKYASVFDRARSKKITERRRKNK